MSASSISLAILLAGMCIWNLIVSIDSTALSTALPTIAADLQATSVEAFWMGTSFVLCSAAFQPILSSWSENFGRKPVLFLALVAFTVGAAVCATARSVAILIFGRCLQGIGGGGMLTLTYVLMADELDLQQRHKAITAISLTWLVGPVLGPILAGLFTEQASWRWIFYFNLPFCLIGTLILLIMPITYQSPKTGLEKFKGIDYFGSTLFVISLASFLVSISWGGTMFAWLAWQTLVPLLLGAAGIVAWIFYSLVLTPSPMIPLDLIMSNRTALISYFGNLFHGIAFFGLLYQAPLFFQTVKQYSPIMSGVAILPLCVISGPSAAVAGLIISRTHRIKWIAVVCWGIFIAGLAILVLLSPSIPVAGWICIQIPAGVALGSLYAALALATQSSVESSSNRTSEEISKIKGVAAGLNPFFRTVGQTLGIVITQAAITNELKKQLGDTAAENATALAALIKLLPTSSPEKARLIAGFSESLKPVWWILAALSGFMMLLTLATKDMGLGDLAATRIPDVESSRASSITIDVKDIEAHRRKFSITGFSDLFFDGVHEGFHHESLHRSSVEHGAVEFCRPFDKEELVVVNVKELP